MSFFSFVVAPPAFFDPAQADPPHLRDRAQPVPRRHPHHRDAAGNAARHPHRQGLHARRHHARALRPQRRGGRARGQQDGARLQPRQPADGNAGRLRDRDRHHLWRLSRDRDRRDARGSSSPSSPPSCWPTSRPSGWPASISSSTAGWSACASCSRCIDSPPSEPADDDKPALQIETPRLEFDDVHFAYRSDEAVLRGMSFVAEPGKLTALVGPPAAANRRCFNLILRFYDAERGRIVIDGQNIAPGVAPLAAPAHRLCRAGRVPVPRHDPRQHRIRQAGRQRGRDRGRRQGRLCARFHHGLPARLRHAGRRARPAAVRRPAPARRDRARADQERADHPARRGHRRARFGIRTAGARGDGSISARAAPRSRSRTGCTRSRTPTAST